MTPTPTAASAQPLAVSIDDIRRPVGDDMDMLVNNLLNVVGDRHPMLMAAAQQIFGAGGKKLRPMLVFLVARATCQQTGRCGLWFCSIRVPAELSSRQNSVSIHACREMTDRHRRLAEITEMIHTASLVHDDVLDECNVRRGEPYACHAHFLISLSIYSFTLSPDVGVPVACDVHRLCATGRAAHLCRCVRSTASFQRDLTIAIMNNNVSSR